MNFYITLVIFLISLFLLFSITTRIQEKYSEDDPMLERLRDVLKNVFPDIQNVILLKGDKSYTINKKRIHLCLTDKGGRYYDQNMLVFVLLHELAHVRCSDIGHTDQFHRIFKELLDVAIQHGIYDPTIPIIKDYCEYDKH